MEDALEMTLRRYLEGGIEKDEWEMVLKKMYNGWFRRCLKFDIEKVT